MLNKNYKIMVLHFLALVCLLIPRPTMADLFEAKEFVSDEDLAYIELLLISRGKNYNGVIKKKFTNPDKSGSDVITISFPTSAYSVDYATKFVEWEDKPEDIIFEPSKIMTAQRLMSKDVLKIADFSDLIDVLGLGLALKAGYAGDEILPARVLSIQIELSNFQKLLDRGYPTSLAETTLSAKLFGVGDLQVSDVEELVKAYELESVEIFKKMTALRVGNNCYHTFNTATFEQTGYPKIAAIGVVSGCVVGGLNITFSNIKYLNRITDAKYVIETAYLLSEQTENYVKLIGVEFE